MSQVAHPTTSLRSQVRAHRIVGVSALLALLATAAVVLVLVIDDGSSGTSSVAQKSQPALRTDGGPDESAVAGVVGARVSSGHAGLPASPSPTAAEAAAAAANRSFAGRPDESGIAASIGNHSSGH
jgi:hypothetical protein